MLSAPVSTMEIVIAYVGAAASKSLILGGIILATAGLFVPLHIDHPLWMLFSRAHRRHLQPARLHHRHLGRRLRELNPGADADRDPADLLGGSFSIDMLPPVWQTVTLFNPVVYLVSGFRWSFYSIADVSPALSLGMTFFFLALCIAIVAWIFRTGYRLKP